MNFGTYERNAVMRFKDQPFRRYHQDGTLPDEGEILVFGSNEAGRHGAGMALVARRCFGAVYGKGRGLQGDTYAIPTKTGNLIVRLIEDIAKDVRDFVQFTMDRPDLSFFVTAVGCGKAGYSARDIAHLFRSAINCSFPEGWRPFLEAADNKESMQNEDCS